MKIKVVLYSILRQKLPQEARGRAEIELPEGSTIAGVLAALEIQGNVLCSRQNQMIRDLDTPVQDGDELHFFLPVGGGDCQKPSFAANLSMLFNEVDFLDRFEHAARAGFSAVEFMFPYEYRLEEIRARLDALRLDLALFNLHPGNAETGEWGTLSSPPRREYFRWSLDTALKAAHLLGCKRLNLMFGNRLEEYSAAEQRDCAIQNLRWALPLAESAGVTLLIEPLNRTDFPKCFLHEPAQALAIIREIDHPFLKLQYDVYHTQMEMGSIFPSLHECYPLTGHIQIADVPGRHQPGSGKIDFTQLFSALQTLEYSGYIGLEYRPLGGTCESLSWLSNL